MDTLEVCTNCGNKLGRRTPGDWQGNAYCSSVECRRVRNRLRMKKFADEYRERTGESYWSRFAAQKSARKAARISCGELQHWRQMNPDLARAVDQRRRARKAGVPSEQIVATEIYERDGWVCGICLDPVLADLDYPEPLSASLDHIVPLSRGGAHVSSNVQCAHLVCNVGKGASLQPLG